MQKRIMLMSAVVVTLLSSCVKDSISEPDFNTDSNGVTFTASMELATKTTLDTETGEVAWAVGDVVKFDYEIGQEDCEPVVSQPLTAEDIVDGIARFTADVPEEFLMTEKEYKESLEEGAKNSRHMYVVYPSVETEYEASTYYVTIPVEQEGSFESASIALAKWNPYTPTAELNFMNLCALLQFTVPEGMTDVRQIVFTAANRKIAGKADVGFGSVVPYTPYVKGMTDESSTTVTVKVDGPGTYYAAVSTGELKDICLAYRDKDGKLVGELVSGVSFNAERAMIYRVGATVEADNFPGEGGYFVKSEACGAKDGSSWDNAADYTALHALLDNDLNGTTAEDARTMTVYMAAGTHSVSKQLNVTPAHNVKVYGGYPADAKGYSLSGRDIHNNVTIIDANSQSKMFNLTNGNWYFDGLIFQNAKSTEGSVFTLQKTVSIEVENCICRNNEATTTGGGAVLCKSLTSHDVKFNNCEFTGNSASATTNTNTGLGGAVMGATAPSTYGTITFTNCLFKQNTAALGGGAICPRTMNCRLVNCNFVDNVGATYGDALYVENSKPVSVYLDGCNIYYTKSDKVGAYGSTNKTNAIITINNTNSKVGLNNCVLSGPWAAKTAQILNCGNSLVVSNSTLLSQTGFPAILADKGNTSLINSIVLNAATINDVPGTGRGLATNGKSVVYHSVLTKVDEGGVAVSATTEKTTYVDNLIVVSNKAETFPVDPTWYGANDSAATMWSNNNASKMSVNDCRGYLYYYAWDGFYPEGASFGTATLDDVKGYVSTADADFATWLGDRLGKDIRGNARDAQSMWPGSYQK